MSHTPFYIKKHIRSRYVVKKFSFLYLKLGKLLKQNPKTNKAIYEAPEVLADQDNTIKWMWETITKLETEFFSPDGK